MKTIELKELDICENCLHRDLRVVNGGETYLMNNIPYYSYCEPHVECKHYYICNEINNRARKIIVDKINSNDDREENV